MSSAIWQRTLASVVSIGVTPDDDEETRLKKAILLTTTLLMSVAGVIWGLLYIAAGEYLGGSIPLAYSVLTIANLTLLTRTHRYEFFRSTQILMTLLLPFILMLVLGGFVSGSAVILWAFLAPLGALLCWQTRQGLLWFGAFLALVIVSGLLAPLIPSDNNLSNAMIVTLYVVNIGAVCSVAFVVLVYFVKQKNLAMQLMRKNRELERANVEQELLLRQSEKLATLGRLSAGVAHELNNPAAAAQRGAAQLREALAQLEQSHIRLGQMDISEEHQATLAVMHDMAKGRARQPMTIDPLARSDQEDELELVLDGLGVDGAWEYAPILADMGCDLDNVTDLAEGFSAAQMPTVLDSVRSTFASHALLEQIGQGTSRISEIVRALKTYTHLDQAPVQFLDVNEGLDDTLVMLRGDLKEGVKIERDYADELPCIQGYGSELNQVWTNIIDNAIDAMDGRGRLRLETFCEGEQVVVEITDNGPGVPAEIQPDIFDPFYTTKTLGEGTGLGLNISRNIVVQRHRGEISVRSQPGETTFVVKLPREMAEPASVSSSATRKNADASSA